MVELGLTTIQIIAATKVILVAYAVILIYLVIRGAKPWQHALAFSGALVIGYVVFAWQFQRMWWGNGGDENLVLAFFNLVLHGHYGQDFYYHSLPPFYPPFYFWLVGSLARFVTANAVAAAKLGVALVLAAWVAVPYLLHRFTWRQAVDELEPVVASPWYWLLAPVVAMLLLDFDAVMFKPFEAFTAVVVVAFVGCLSVALHQERWPRVWWILFPLTAGLSLLTYYFWFVVAAPVLALVASAGTSWKRAWTRLLGVGVGAALVAAPYWVPLVVSFFRFGMEDWQGNYFLPQDLATFNPWFALSLRGVLALIGLGGLILGSLHSKAVRSVTILFVGCYVYQLVALAILLMGGRPLVASKPFFFLGTAALAAGTAYAVVWLGQQYLVRYSLTQTRVVTIGILLALLPLMPWGNFTSDPVVQAQVEKDIVPSRAQAFALNIQAHVPDYAKRTWLVADSADLPGYIPLNHFIALSASYSHQAAGFSKRLAQVKALTQAKGAAEFAALADAAQPQGINALFLYHESSTKSYPLLFWVDNFPNGSKQVRYAVPEQLIAEPYWQKVSETGEWMIFVRTAVAVSEQAG